ncbi:MAG: hypothetical protein WCC06_07490 [Candidatus Aminicenantales bacterium]
MDFERGNEKDCIVCENSWKWIEEDRWQARENSTRLSMDRWAT